ncbi:hypothetical protein M1446_04870 [Candidatus Dependentiae bacterium]|nr:hypothetical protein [Candidatus Dependentiae bacterium]
MKIKKLLYPIILILSFNLIGQEYQNLPQEIRVVTKEEMFKPVEFNSNNLDSIVQSYKNHHHLSRTNEDFRFFWNRRLANGFTMYEDWLLKKLDFKMLNQYILDQSYLNISRHSMPESFLIILEILRNLKKLDPEIEKRVPLPCCW